MPHYSFHVGIYNKDSTTQKIIYTQVTTLHSETFSCDPLSVRVEFIETNSTHGVRDFGGYGYRPATGVFGSGLFTDYLVVSMDFTGTAEEWQSYCRKLVRISNGKLRSIYLQRNQFEFEVRGSTLPGVIVRQEERGVESGEKGKRVDPPAYEK